MIFRYRLFRNFFMPQRYELFQILSRFDFEKIVDSKMIQ